MRRVLIAWSAGVVLLVSGCTTTAGGTAQPNPTSGASSASTTESLGSSIASSSTTSSTTVTSSTPSSTVASSTSVTSSTVTVTTSASTGTTSSATSTTPSISSSTSTDTNDILGPDGWQTLKLGMTPDQAAGLGLFIDMPDLDGACGYWTAPDAAAIEGAVLSPTMGVVAITPRDGAVLKSPEGMKVGWTADEVAAAYPDFLVEDAHAPNGPLVKTTGGTDSRFRLRFDDFDVLQSFTLELTYQDCYA